MKKKPPPPKPESQKKPVKNKHEDSDDIERAVYDGMQDLRAEKPRK